MRGTVAQFAVAVLLLSGVCRGESPGGPALTTKSAQQITSLVQQGIAYAHAGNYPLAESAYRRALKIDPHYLPAQINLGLAYFKSIEYEKAIPPLEQAVREGVDSDQVHTLLAMSLYALHRYEGASRHYEVLFSREPANTMLGYLLAESYMRSHQADKLPDFLRRLQAAAPDSPVIYMIAGEQYDRLDQTDKAINEFLKAEAAAPQLPMVHFSLGYFYWEQHLMDKAVEQFQAERELKDGETSEAKGYLGDIALSNGQYLEAEHLLRESLAKDPEVRIAQYDLGVICAQKKAFPEAVEHFKSAVALDPKRADAYYRLAMIYRELGQHDQLRAVLAKVEQLNKAQRATVADAFSAHNER